MPKAAALLFWRRWQDLNLRIPPGAVLYRLSYICVSRVYGYDLN